MDPSSDKPREAVNQQAVKAAQNASEPTVHGDRKSDSEEGGPTSPPSDRAAQGASPPAPAQPVRSRRLSGAEMLASVDAGSDGSLNQAMAEAMMGISDADMAGLTGGPPPSDSFSVETIVPGRIANIGSEDVLIDFGGKCLGVMPNSELDGDQRFATGDKIEVMVLGEDDRTGLVKVSRERARRATVLQSMKVGAVVEGTVTGMNKGGLDITIEGIRGFIPASQVDLHFMKDISNLIGEKVRVEVTQFDPDGEDLVVSRRKVLQKEEAEKKEETFAVLQVGEVRRGIVRSVAEYGAFVDIGGVDGLLHVSDMSWGRVKNPEELVQVGQELEVKILKLQHDKKKVSLGLKQVTGNPWDQVEAKFQPQTRLKGRVVRLEKFGAFVELEPGIDGLLPMSEMSWTKRLRHPSDLVKEGDIVEVVVLSIDAERKRISLGLKQLAEDPWLAVAEKYPTGITLKRKVVRTTEFGAFVELEDGVDGLVHISEIDDKRIKAVTDKVKPGDEVEVRVLGVDLENKRISLSMRKPPVEPTPEEIAAIQAQREAQRKADEKKKPSKPRRGGITIGWDQGLGSLDPSQFSR